MKWGEELERVVAAAGPEGLAVTAAELEMLRAAAERAREDVRRENPSSSWPAPDPLPEPRPVLQAPRQCLAACLATITGLPREALELPLPPEASEAWLLANGAKLWTWVAGRLAELGWLLVPLARGEIPAGFAIAVGRMTDGAPHAVVYRDGVLWHDPAPAGGGLRAVQTFSAVLPLARRPRQE